MTGAVPVHLASTSDQFLHEREPPDGKEKPEPACKAGGAQQMEGKMATLSRKSSKSDLLEQRSSAAGVSASEATREVFNSPVSSQFEFRCRNLQQLNTQVFKMGFK